MLYCPGSGHELLSTLSQLDIPCFQCLSSSKTTYIDDRSVFKVNGMIVRPAIPVALQYFQEQIKLELDKVS